MLTDRTNSPQHPWQPNCPWIIFWSLFVINLQKVSPVYCVLPPSLFYVRCASMLQCFNAFIRQKQLHKSVVCKLSLMMTLSVKCGQCLTLKYQHRTLFYRSHLDMTLKLVQITYTLILTILYPIKCFLTERYFDFLKTINEDKRLVGTISLRIGMGTKKKIPNLLLVETNDVIVKEYKFISIDILF